MPFAVRDIYCGRSRKIIATEPALRDNKIGGVHILKKSDGTWKIYDTQIDSIDYLN
jgi:hypothetical protein